MRPTYQGVMRSGAHCMGTVPQGIDVSTFVQRKYRASWTSLEVRQDGRTVGEIDDNDNREVRGRRTWWAEL